MTFMTLAGIAVLKSMAGHHFPVSTQRKDASISANPSGQLAEILPSLPLDDNPKGKGNDSVVCSLDVADWELAKVLRVLSQQTNVNVITMSAPDKKLTIRLADVKLADMIRHICAITGMASLKTGGTYVIATAEQLKTAYPVEWAIANPVQVDPATDLTTDFYMCSFVNASQIADSLTKLFNDGNATSPGSQKLQVVCGPMQRVPTLATPDTSAGTGASSAMIKSDAGTGGGGGGGAAQLTGK